MPGNVNVRMPDEMHDWVTARAAHEGVSAGQLVRNLIEQYRTENQETTKMVRPKDPTTWNKPVTPKKGRYTADRPLREAEKVRPPRTTCPRCGASVNVSDDGPAYHLRPSRPGDENYRTDLPTMTPCLDGGQ